MNTETWFKDCKTLDICFNPPGMLGTDIIEISNINYGETGIFCREAKTLRKGFIPWTAVKYLVEHSDEIDVGLEDQKIKGKKILDKTLKMMEAIE